MRFTSLAVILCSLQCLVWALPLMQSTGQTLVRRGKAIPHELSLVQHNPGKANEHWALHFHPTDTNADETHLLHAVSSKSNGGVLETDKETKPAGYTPKEGSIIHHLAHFDTKGKAMAAMKSAESIHLSEQFPTDNCVDFACHAVAHLAAQGHIPEAAKTTFDEHYNAHQAAVRKKTDTPTNRQRAGVER